MNQARLLWLPLFIMIFPSLGWAESSKSSYLTQLFHESTLTINSAADGFGADTLRGALIRAQALRSKDPFRQMKIVFSPEIKQVRITQGPLPPLEAGLTEIDCKNNMGKVEIVWSAAEASRSPQNFAGLRILSSGNRIHNCRFLDFPGTSFLIGGNDNEISSNQFEGPSDTAPQVSPLYPNLRRSPKNKTTSLRLEAGASANRVYDNEMTGLQNDGIVLASDAGNNNKLIDNKINGYRNRALRVDSKNLNLTKPILEKISLQGEVFRVTGRAERNSEIYLYPSGNNAREINKERLGQGKSGNDGSFFIEVKKNAFSNGDKIIALAYRPDKNTSEYTESFAIPLLSPETPSLPLQEVPEPKTEPEPRAEEMPPVEAPAPIEATPQAFEQPLKSMPDYYPKEKLIPKAIQPDAFINIQGLGISGGEPDQGAGATSH